ncbi:MAG: alternate F1F0 ATPase, F1 subunit alpha [Anaeromusa sp.]|uniref:alternate F1F0 ATPase, F1 subunit alpha n=1 Tax=Anaeromusa sp. TaxID=1872520 RepID=UPI002B1EE1DE|nr:alternate F1F0 ATPase, F1 subunit alpha [Anaeromusa sp.]MEA4836144.1 alternate F1F0 ATPase, F1 subunit alpha [Anaeromusa sp.]
METEAKRLPAVMKEAFVLLRQAREACQPSLKLEQIGLVRSVANGVVWVSGLQDAAMDEVVEFSREAAGLVFDVTETQTGIVLLDAEASIEAGDEVRRTGRVADVPVGEGLLGRVINPNGKPLDGKGPLAFAKRRPIEQEAPQILQRAAVAAPLQTGIKLIDAMIPIGRGQRQLLIGDRQTGKTSLAIDTIINQQQENVLCIYCAIGQRGSSLAKSVAELTARKAMDYTVVVVTEGNDAPGMRYIAPYAATAIAEEFMEQGRDVLIVYDDLTKHAHTYREISLLLRRPPGREAFPGDIFYIHSRLLERATRLRKEFGGGSLTALPIVQTEAQNIAAYIPTNLISITDGQLYLSPELFQKGILPAIDVGKSVSRVGGKAQLAAYHSLAGNLKLSYSQFEELEAFSRFGTRVDERTRKALVHGQRIRACLKQSRTQSVTVYEQLGLLLALTKGVLDAIPENRLAEAEGAIIAAMTGLAEDVRAKIAAGKALAQEEEALILSLFQDKLTALEADHDTDAGKLAT